MSEHCVYVLTCAATGKAYIGLTKVGARRRFAAHCYNARTGKGGALYAAIRKHGADSFTVDTVAEGLTVEQACALEVLTIAERGTLAPDGYNIARGGERGLLGVTLTAETRQRMSATHATRQEDPTLRERTAAALRGRPKTAEHVAKVAAALRGKQCSEETRAKLRAANLGKQQGAETVAKRAAKLRGRKMPESACAALGNRTRGVPKSTEHRRKLSEALKGRKLDPEMVERRAAKTRGKPKSEEWKAKMRAIWARKREERLRAG